MPWPAATYVYAQIHAEVHMYMPTDTWTVQITCKHGTIIQHELETSEGEKFLQISLFESHPQKFSPWNYNFPPRKFPAIIWHIVQFIDLQFFQM